jgi:hypothetical protein
LRSLYCSSHPIHSPFYSLRHSSISSQWCGQWHNAINCAGRVYSHVPFSTSPLLEISCCCCTHPPLHISASSVFISHTIASQLPLYLFFRRLYTLSSVTMPSKAPKVEPLSRDHWENFPPPVDQDLWRRNMIEEDSDGDDSDIEQEYSMAGPSNTSQSTKADVSGAKPTAKNDLVSYVKLHS